VTPPEPDLIGARILLVDDDDGNREVVMYYLKRQGFDVTAVSSGRDALQELDRAAFRLVLLDVIMPDMDGFAALGRIRQTFSPTGLPVVMLTGMDPDEATLTAAVLGANDCIAKPYQLADILACVRRHLLASTPLERGRTSHTENP